MCDFSTTMIEHLVLATSEPFDYEPFVALLYLYA